MNQPKELGNYKINLVGLPNKQEIVNRIAKVYERRKLQVGRVVTSGRCEYLEAKKTRVYGLYGRNMRAYVNNPITEIAAQDWLSKYEPDFTIEKTPGVDQWAVKGAGKPSFQEYMRGNKEDNRESSDRELEWERKQVKTIEPDPDPVIKWVYPNLNEHRFGQNR
jgi:hypothetical protein